MMSSYLNPSAPAEGAQWREATLQALTTPEGVPAVAFAGRHIARFYTLARLLIELVESESARTRREGMGRE